MISPTDDLVLPGQVKRALKSFHDLSALGRSPLAGWRSILQRLEKPSDPLTHIDLGRALQKLLNEAIEALKPGTPYSPAALPWRHYTILDYAYRKRVSSLYIYATVLSISKSEFYREREQAIAALTRVLTEMELNAATHVFTNVWAGTPIPRIRDFVGRARELEACQRRLEMGNIAVITGMPGVGKTSLGAELAGRFPDRRAFWLQFIAGENDNADAVIHQLARLLAHDGRHELAHLLALEALTHERRPWSEKSALLLGGLEAGRYLLCFDDAHVVEGNETLHNLFTRFRAELKHTKLLIISHRVPDFAQDLSPAPLPGLSRSEVRQWLAQMGLSGLSAEALDRLYAKTQGHPKFIGLLIAWMRNLGLTAGADIEGFIQTFATDTLRIRSIEHYLLENVFKTLAEPERHLMAIAAAFRGRFSLRDEDIEDILANEGLTDPLVLINRLLEKNLLSESFEARDLDLHPLVREYFYHRTPLADRQRIHGRLGRYFAEHGDYLEAAYHYSHAGQLSQAVALITDNLETLISTGQALAALSQLEAFSLPRLTSIDRLKVYQARGELYELTGQHPDAMAGYEAALSLATAPADMAAIHHKMGRLHRQKGGYEKAIHHLTLARQALESGDEPTPVLEMARVHNELAFTFVVKGDLSPGEGLCQATLEQIGRVIETPENAPLRSQLRQEQALAHKTLGQVYSTRGHYPQAIEHCRRSLDLYEEVGYAPGMVTVCINLGYLLASQELYDQAMAYLQQGLHLSERMGDISSIARAYNHMGIAHFRQGDLRQAREYYLKSLAMWEKIGNLYNAAILCNNLGEVCHRQGDYNRALAYVQRSQALLEQLGDTFVIATAYATLGEIQCSQGRYAEALGSHHRSLTLRQTAGYALGIARSLLFLGQVYHCLGDEAQALASFQESLDRFEQLGVKWGIASVYRSLGELHADRGDYAQAVLYLEEALRRGEELSNKEIVCYGCAALGKVRVAMGEGEVALQLSQKALTLAEELGSAVAEGIACRLLGEAWAHQGDSVQAEHFLRRSIETLERIGHPLEAGRTWRSYGAFLRAQGILESGDECLAKARAIFESLGAKGEQPEVDQPLAPVYNTPSP
jgi:tetratricopeptide (TPR) repeat protein